MGRWETWSNTMTFVPREAGTGRHRGALRSVSSPGCPAAEETTPALDPTALRAEGCAGWERRGGAGVESFLSHFEHDSAAWSRPCGELFLCPHVSPLPVLTDPIPPAGCSALPCRNLPGAGHCPGHLRVCRCYGAGETNLAEAGKVLLALSVG